MRSVRIRSPLPRTSRTIGKFDKVTLAAGTVFNRRPGICRKALRQKELQVDSHYNTWPAIGASAPTGKDARPVSPIKSKVRQVVRNVRDTVPASRTDLANLERSALEEALVARGHQRFRAHQIFQWIYRHGVPDVAALSTMSDVPRGLREQLAAEFALTTPDLTHRERSIDGAEKFLLRLADGQQIESVFIPGTPSMTFCISTQVGCAMACAFCLTGKMGLIRNLTAGEIAGQVRVLAGALDLRDNAFNNILICMGEPLHNYDETMKALRILTDEHGFAMSPRRITLSTVGLLPALERLAREPVIPNLAISLHAPTDAQRGELVPINKKHGVSDIIEACKRFPLKRRNRITFEYVLLAGVNDSPADARRLAKLRSEEHTSELQS